MLSQCQGYRKVHGLPTWAPDWTCRPVYESFPSGVTAKPLTFDTVPSPHLPPASFSADLRIMSVRGFVIGVVADATLLASSGPASTTSRPGGQAVPVASLGMRGMALTGAWMDLKQENDPLLPVVEAAVWFIVASSGWLFEKGICTLCLRLFSCGIQRYMLWRSLPSSSFAHVLGELDKVTELVAELSADVRLGKQRSEALRREKRAAQRRSREQPGSENFESYNFEPSEEGHMLPRAMENIYRPLEGDEETMREDHLSHWLVQWCSVLDKSWYSEHNFGTSCREPRRGDVIVLLVGSRGAHLLRPDDADGHWSLVGNANLGLCIRWLWDDAVRLYHEGKCELAVFDLK
ncbi:uncharacterized protein B0I36DRAFT_321703 [Microdochium trichocladiopsis]|uniref:Uncharacterized protein n=1 Tax=Microdochium trichocladiopsis TaxID=1682393 RepID=A0A9P8YCI3_9PEZI|nr:uncharacterized protein B0I36DRAFT_321703 [Microdochium trichocladiopsis]KAH7033578.1 hypothetical protein B0I36DRAFT_321703 [Microdochium trichocladiopsis]